MSVTTDTQTSEKSVVATALLSYRVDQHEKQIEALRKHSHAINQSLVAIQENCNMTNNNFNDLLDQTKAISERIKVLERDLSDRVIKSGVIRKILSMWPLILIIILAISAIISQADHDKIITLLKAIA